MIIELISAQPNAIIYDMSKKGKWYHIMVIATFHHCISELAIGKVIFPYEHSDGNIVYNQHFPEFEGEEED